MKRVVKYFVKNDKNGCWFSFTVEFVQLSRGIQVASGESVLLRCLVNKPVVQCEWSWKASNSSQEPLLVKKFNPNKDADHDCSVRFKNILYEEEGLWTCGVRLSPDGILHEAPPATVSLLPTGINWEDGKKFVSNRERNIFLFSIVLHPLFLGKWKKNQKIKSIVRFILFLVPAKVNFVEMPTDTSVPVGTEAMLKCVTSSRVEKCTWFWKPLHGNEPEIVIEEYPSNGDLGRDCSFTFPKVYIEKQGQWACQVSIGSLNTILTSPYAKLTVFEQGIFTFVKVLQFPPPLVHKGFFTGHLFLN